MCRIFVLFLCIFYANAAFEGEGCNKNGRAGSCVNINRCHSAKADLRKGIAPQICSFDINDPIICCFDQSGPHHQPTQPPMATTAKRPIQTTTMYIPTEPTYVDMNGNKVSENQCEPIDPKLTSPKTGRKAWDKCVDYQEQLVYPCTISESLAVDSVARGKKCNHNADELIVGGEDSHLNEFPHMALLGFGEEPRTKWECGGSLISDRFILTAGHCLSSRDYGKVTYAALGALRRQDIVNFRKHRIVDIIRHPGYRPPHKYNDIMLLKTDKPVKLDQFVVPACLHVGDAVNETLALASGWGLTANNGQVSDVLQRVILTKYTNQECQKKFKNHRHNKKGINPSTQMCYGDKVVAKDTCYGDSGGPLQIKSTKLNCMYVIIGVTSFGKECGHLGDPGVYTRVQDFVPWIESIVWPDD